MKWVLAVIQLSGKSFIAAPAPFPGLCFKTQILTRENIKHSQFLTNMILRREGVGEEI